MYREGSETFTVPIEGWGASQVAKGDTVKVIFNLLRQKRPTYIHSFSYCSHFSELLISALAYIVLFIAAVIYYRTPGRILLLGRGKTKEA
jgi:hypothetical protein